MQLKLTRLILPNHIHLWQIDLNKINYLDYVSLLSEDEKERAFRFIFEKHRRRFILAHVGLRKILSEYLEIAPENIEFESLAHGKPVLLTKQNPIHLEFNLSHSGETALVGLRLDKMIGVDIEYHQTRDLLDLAEHVFSEKESQSVREISDKQGQIEAFFHIWAQKEAFIKAVGQGLSYPLKDFTVSASFPSKLLEAKNENITDWYFHGFKPFENAHAALATINPVEEILYFNFIFSI